MKKNTSKKSKHTNQISKKAISSIIATILILGVTVSVGLAGLNWYSSFTSNYEGKKMQAYTSDVSQSVQLLALKSENSTYNLYLKNNLAGYVVITQISVNNAICSMPTSNIIQKTSISQIEISCPNLQSANNITIITDVGIISAKKRLS